MNPILRSLIYCLPLFAASWCCAGPTPEPSPAIYSSNVANAPLLFTENNGQVADIKGNLRPDILFTAHSRGAKIFLTATGIHYQFTRVEYPRGYELDERRVKDHEKQEKLRRKIKTSTHRFTLSLIGANPHPRIRKEEQNIYTENFYLAHCPDGITGVHTYSRVVMEGVYPGIDWVVYSNGQGMKYDFVVHPGANPSQIRLRVRNAKSVRVSEEGDLVISTSLGTVREKAPMSFSDRRPVNTSFIKNGEEIQFAVSAYDNSRVLIVDPSVGWSTYYGGIDEERGANCTTDSLGNVYLAGTTHSSTGIAFGGFQNTIDQVGDAFLVKFNGNGIRLWSTYYGGDWVEDAVDCATDNTGNIFLAGVTGSGIGIASGGFQNVYGGGSADYFLVKFGGSGTRQWATYYGGSGDEWDFPSCATDGAGNVYLAGTTQSPSGIAFNGFQNVYNGGQKALLAKFSDIGVRLWATYYGGNNGSESHSVCATDNSGNVYLTGSTNSTSGVSSNGFQNVYGGGTNGGLGDAFLVKFNGSGSRLWSTYYGGSSDEALPSCATDNLGNVYLAGNTHSSSGIASGGFQNVYGGGALGDAFLVKFSGSGARLWGTYYGGSGNEAYQSCIADNLGNVYLAGITTSTSGIASGGFQNSYGGASGGSSYGDAFLVKFTGVGARLWGTYFGGSDNEGFPSCATDNFGNVYLAGETGSLTGIASGGFQNAYAGSRDVFLVKMSDDTSQFAVVNTISGNQTLSDVVLYQGTVSASPPTVRICADGSKATRVVFINRDAAIPSSGVRFRIAAAPAASNPELYGYFTSYAANGDTVTALLQHPEYLPNNTGLFRADDIEIVDSSAASIPLIYSIPIQVYRAPVLMVHGLWADRRSFEDLHEELASSGKYVGGILYAADYSWPGGKNAYKFANNAPVPPREINYLLQQCRMAGFSAGKVDYVGHSMGGLLGRQYIQSASYRKDINKLITVNTPHSGTQSANFLQNQNFPTVALLMGHFGYDPTLGAVEDLQTNSLAISNLNSSGTHPNYGNVATHAIATRTNSIYYAGWAAKLIGLGAAANGLWTANAFLDHLYYSEDHDLVVPLSSQQGGLTGAASSVFSNQQHIGSCDNSSIQSQILSLLNTAPPASAFTHSGFTPPTLSSHYRPVANTSGNKPTGSGNVTINTPTVGQSFQPGDIVTMNVTSTGTINHLSIFYGNNDLDVIMRDSAVSNASFQFTVPLEAIGTLKLAAVGSDNDGLIDYDTVSVNVIVTATLDSLLVYPDTLIVAVNSIEPLYLQGIFSDNVVRNLSNVSGFQYTITDTALASQSNGNAILGKQTGMTNLVVSYAGKSVQIPLVVIPEDQTNYTPASVPETPHISLASEGQTLRVFPNPTASSFTVLAPASAGKNVTIEVYNAVGAKVLTQTGKASSGAYTRTVSLSEASPGIYYIRVITSDTRLTGKVVIIK